MTPVNKFLIALDGQTIATSGMGVDLFATGWNEVGQNVLFTVSTVIGDQILDREFGLNYAFIDKPMHLAQQSVLSEVLSRVVRYEPRVKFNNIAFSVDPSTLLTTCQLNFDKVSLTLPNSYVIQ